MLLEKSREIAPEGMKRLSQSRNDTQFWMCLVEKGKSRAVKNNIAMTNVLSWRHSVRLDLLTDTKKKEKKRCPLHHRGLDAKVGNQEITLVTGKFGLGEQNEAGQRLTECCQENALVVANTLFQPHKRRLYT